MSPHFVEKETEISIWINHDPDTKDPRVAKLKHDEAAKYAREHGCCVIEVEDLRGKPCSKLPREYQA